MTPIHTNIPALTNWNLVIDGRWFQVQSSTQEAITKLVNRIFSLPKTLRDHLKPSHKTVCIHFVMLTSQVDAAEKELRALIPDAINHSDHPEHLLVLKSFERALGPLPFASKMECEMYKIVNCRALRMALPRILLDLLLPTSNTQTFISTYVGSRKKLDDWIMNGRIPQEEIDQRDEDYENYMGTSEPIPAAAHIAYKFGIGYQECGATGPALPSWAQRK